MTNGYYMDILSIVKAVAQRAKEYTDSKASSATIDADAVKDIIGSQIESDFGLVVQDGHICFVTEGDD